ncbi:LYR motif-containing protein 4-like [Tubulanus polymorphus]|uniref:LYR motif-containing protein 4-like n=1 Tax=Tubulanus polymorphus TaxID=672921 RepID=UPI003DA6914D
MSVSRISILQLYRAMMRESKKFTGYNYREYALRRTRDGFKEHKAKTDPAEIAKLYNIAQENFAVIKRQVVISQLYQQPKIVIEENGS